MTSKPLLLHAGPVLREGVTTPGLMFDVLLALVPIFGAAIWFFGLSALLLVATSVAGCVIAEWLWDRVRPRGQTMRDGSAILTGVLLGLTLPPGLPMWMAFVGGLAAIGLGKTVWGGLGHNLFNPALVGRAFLQAAFPVAMTTWSAPGDALAVRASNFAMPLMQGNVDAISSATPLNKMKLLEQAPFTDLFFGSTSGSLGETSALLLILAGIYLIARRTFDWRIPVGIVVSVAVCSAAIYAFGPDKYPPPQFALLSGGLLFGAVFMATDPVTSPMAPRGVWIFAAGIGFLVVLIRVFGGLPEGVMYSILLMNSATPLIERYCQPRAFGR